MHRILTHLQQREATARKLLPLFVVAIALMWGMFGSAPRAQAISMETFSLDSISQWGKFPKLCIDVYRWGDKFFNSYDSTYVQGSGKRWNIKMRANSWSDTYNLQVVDGYRMSMISQPSTTAGFYLTYMAVSVGYDVDMNKMFGSAEKARQRWNLQFNCSLFAVEFQAMKNDVGTTVTRFGMPGETKRYHERFPGVNNSMWQLDTYYFFNHKHYSQAAAFYYSKIQQKSSGSLYAGLSFSKQKYRFDFSTLSIDGQPLTSPWNDNYDVENMNYALKIGYGYNWVFRRGWCLGVSEAPIIGIRHGWVNRPGERGLSFAFSNQLRASLIYNYHKRWFFGLVGQWDAGLVYDKEHTMMASNVSGEISVGYRFDLW